MSGFYHSCSASARMLSGGLAGAQWWSSLACSPVDDRSFNSSTASHQVHSNHLYHTSLTDRSCARYELPKQTFEMRRQTPPPGLPGSPSTLDRDRPRRVHTLHILRGLVMNCAVGRPDDTGTRHCARLCYDNRPRWVRASAIHHH